MRLLKFSIFAIALLTTYALVSCGDDEDDNGKSPANVDVNENNNKQDSDSTYSFTGETIFDKISSQQGLSDFAYILKRAGYDKQLSTYGTYTVFAPKNEGIRAYIEELYNNEHASEPHHGMSANSLDGLTDLLCELIAKQHIVQAAIPIASFRELFGENATITNLNGDKVTFTNNGEGVWMLNNRATILQADVSSNNGYLNVLDKTIFLNQETINEVALEDYWQSKANIEKVLMDCYFSCIAFESDQLGLEQTRLYHSKKDDDWQPIKPTDGHIQDAFTSAYSTINRTNVILRYAPDVKSMSDDELEAILAEARCIRAFVYYNIAMLWGDVVLVTKALESDDVPMTYTQSKQADVYQFAYREICEVVDKLPVSYSSELATMARFTRKAGLTLKAELELTLGHRQEAEEILRRLGSGFVFGFANQEQVILPIYTAEYLALLQAEVKGNTENLEKEWATLPTPQYGYWAALKRLGKAQTVTGCFDYELLMPFPRNEIEMNPNLRQNPGYEDQEQSYAELKERERKAISNYIAYHHIAVISESQFKRQSDMTDVSKNEFVFMAESGVYMQIVRKGCGETFQEEETRTILARFTEQNMLDTTIVIGNCDWYAVDKMVVARKDNVYSANFIEGMMYLTYGASVPNGWLKSLPYILIGRPTSPDDEIAKVRLIVPHTQGHQYALANVIPYYYEITFQQ